MESSKLVVKFFAQNPTVVDHHAFVPAFHSWIQTHAVEDHLLIDVADYQHVHDGPGTVLVAHEAIFYAERFGGRLGLSYWRKQPLEGSFADRVRYAITAAIQGCARLEEDARLNGLKFKTDEVSLKINDRLLAPNTPQTFASVKDDVQRVASEIFGGAVQLEQRGTAKELFEISIKPAKATTIAELAKRFPAAVNA